MIERKNGVLMPDDTKPYIQIYVWLSGPLEESLSEEERFRLLSKIKMVKRAAAHLMAGMIKGTTKYPNDTWTVREWLNYLKDDAMDVVNYAFLLEFALQEAAFVEPSA